MSDIETVMIYSSKIEKLLKEEFNAQGTGLGQQVRDVEYLLDPGLVAKIKWISRTRNQAAHDPMSYRMPREFVPTCEQVLARLQHARTTVNSRPSNYPAPADQFAAPNTSTVSRTPRHQPISQSPPLVILFSWMFAHSLGTVLGVLGILIVGGIIKVSNIFSALEPFRNLYMSVNIVLILLIPFLALGFRQQRFMQRFPFEHSSKWARATVLGGMLVTAITLLLMINSNYQGAQQFILTLPTVLRPGSYMFLGAVMGLSTGFFQFFLLRKTTTKARWWLVASGLQGMVMYGLWQYFTDLLKGFGNVIWFLLAPSLSSLVTGVALLYLAKSLDYRHQT
jgi:hypothetical protein